MPIDGVALGRVGAQPAKQTCLGTTYPELKLPLPNLTNTTAGLPMVSLCCSVLQCSKVLTLNTEHFHKIFYRMVCHELILEID